MLEKSVLRDKCKNSIEKFKGSGQQRSAPSIRRKCKEEDDDLLRED